MNQSEQSQLEHNLELLGAESSHGWNDIEKQYRKLAQKWHPDRNTGLERDTAKSKFIEINAAYKYIRSHYRKMGTIQHTVPTERPGPLLGTKKQSIIKHDLYKNKLFITSTITMIIAIIFGALLWSLDSRLTKNNRGRATAEKISSPTELNLRQLEPILKYEDVSVQSSEKAL